MFIRIRGAIATLFTFSLIIYFAIICGCSRSKGPSLEDIPRYPNATEVDSMKHSSFGGIAGGSLMQFTTNDTYDKVLDFYKDALKTYDPSVLSHASELGRQTAISFKQKKGMLSVVIQEFSKEGKVNITLMQVGS